MNSRWTLRLLATAVAVVWGLVAWRILVPDRADAPVDALASAVPERPTIAAETLRADYPDPFLKGAPAPPPARRPLQPQQRPVQGKPRRTPPRAVHLASFAAAGRTFHVVTLDDRPYELQRGDTAAGFRLRGADADSLYLEREGLVYGIERCAR